MRVRVSSSTCVQSLGHENMLFVSLRLKCHPKQFICPISVIQSRMMTLDAAAAVTRTHLALVSRRFKAIFKARLVRLPD